MIKYASFAVITLFWVVMNGWLWRAEFGTGSKIAGEVPVSLVWEKILTSPDDSALSIHFQGKKLGYLRVRPNALEAGASEKIANENEPEGIVRKISGYTLQLEGSFVAEGIARSVRFDSEFAFDESQTWNSFQVNSYIRPQQWQIKGNATAREVWFQSKEGDSEWIQRFSFDDLRDPRQLARLIESPLVLALLPQYLSANDSATNAPLTLGMRWDARYEWLRIGQNRVRIYRLEAKLLDRFSVVVLVSRVGEILRVELPGDLKFVNEVLYAT